VSGSFAPWFTSEGFLVGVELSFHNDEEALRRLYVAGLTAKVAPCEVECRCELCDWYSSPSPVHVNVRRALLLDYEISLRSPWGPFVHAQAITRIMRDAEEVGEVTDHLAHTLDGHVSTAQCVGDWLDSLQVNVSATRTNRVGVLRLMRRYASDLLLLMTDTDEVWDFLSGACASIPSRRHGCVAVGLLNADRWRKTFGTAPVPYSQVLAVPGGKCIHCCLRFHSDSNRVEFSVPSTTDPALVRTFVWLCIGLYRAAYVGFTNEQLDAGLFEFVRPYLYDEVELPK
jgi:hypothetical protein